MADRTLQEFAAETGVAYATLKKHAQRGQLKTRREGARIFIADEDAETYMVAHGLEKAADAVREFGSEGEAAVREVGNVIARLPARVQTAILEGLPTTKKPGSPDAFLKAAAAVPQLPEVSGESDDPHFGRPIGYQHAESPRWKRVSESRWSLNGSSWDWNGLFWEGKGDAEGRAIGEGISPSNPFSDQRPLGPSSAKERKK